MDFNALLDKSEDINSVRLSGTIDINEAGEYELIKEERGKLSVFIDDERVMEVWQTILSTPRYTHIDLSKGTHKIVIEYTQQKDEFPTLKWRKPSEKNELLSLWSASAKNIDYYFIYGEENMDQVVSGFRKLTGKATLLPKWAYGFWQSRNRYQSQEEIVSMAKKLRGNKIPFDNIVLDWHYWVNDTWGSHTFNEKAFPDASAMTDELHDLNANVMISVWPKFYPETANYKELETAGALYTKFADEKGVDFRNHLNTYYDPFNPEGREIYWNQINREIYSHGFDAWWLDGTEPSFDKDFDANKRAYYMEPNAFGKGYDYLNLFALYNSKAIYEGQRSVDPNKRAFILTRSSFAGMQEYAAVAWSGDVAASWDMFRSEIAAGLNYSLSGMPYWTDDIGGYISEMRDGTYFYDEFEELFTRWFQFGTFSPIFRAHGDQHPQNMLAFKKDYFEAQLKFDKLRYSLMPYIYSVAGAVTHDDYTMMRGLVFDFADDPKVLDITDQFMFGPSLLICPVTEYEARERDVYLPATTDWYDFWTGKYYKGGKSYSVTAPLDQMPIFVKAGSIIPFGPEIQYTSEKKPESILLKVYEGADAAFELYEDEGTNYNYQGGAFSEINISWDDTENLLKISDSKGEYKGMLKDRKFQVELVSEKSPSGYNDEPKPIENTDYSGKQVELDLN
ncbi:MAG: TIM-barrel domain-containing protein [Pricia sp.]